MFNRMKLYKAVSYMTLAFALTVLPTVGETMESLTGKLNYLNLQDARTHKMEPIPFLTVEDTGETVMLLNVWPDEYPENAVIKVMGVNKKDYFEVNSVIVISGGKPKLKKDADSNDN